MNWLGLMDNKEPWATAIRVKITHRLPSAQYRAMQQLLSFRDQMVQEGFKAKDPNEHGGAIILRLAATEGDATSTVKGFFRKLSTLMLDVGVVTDLEILPAHREKELAKNWYRLTDNGKREEAEKQRRRECRRQEARAKAQERDRRREAKRLARERKEKARVEALYAQQEMRRHAETVRKQAEYAKGAERRKYLEYSIWADRIPPETKPPKVNHVRCPDLHVRHNGLVPPITMDYYELEERRADDLLRAVICEELKDDSFDQLVEAMVEPVKWYHYPS